MMKDRWTDADHKTLAAKMFERWKQRPLEGTTPIAKHIMAHDWPEANRKAINAVSATSLPKVYHEFTALVRQHMERLANASVDGEAPPMPEFIEVEKLALPDPADFMAGQPLEILVLEVVSRFTRTLNGLQLQLQTMAAGLEQRRNGHEKHFFVPPPQPVPVGARKDARTRIGVVGLFRDQFEHVREKVGDRVELVFIDKDMSQTTFPATVQKVIVQKHSRHRWFEQARERFGNDNVFFVEGAITAVIQKVFDISSRQP